MINLKQGSMRLAFPKGFPLRPNAINIMAYSAIIGTESEKNSIECFLQAASQVLEYGMCDYDEVKPVEKKATEKVKKVKKEKKKIDWVFFKKKEAKTDSKETKEEDVDDGKDPFADEAPAVEPVEAPIPDPMTVIMTVYADLYDTDRALAKKAAEYGFVGHPEDSKLFLKLASDLEAAEREEAEALSRMTDEELAAVEGFYNQATDIVNEVLAEAAEEAEQVVDSPIINILKPKSFDTVVEEVPVPVQQPVVEQVVNAAAPEFKYEDAATKEAAEIFDTLIEAAKEGAAKIKSEAAQPVGSVIPSMPMPELQLDPTKIIARSKRVGTSFPFTDYPTEGVRATNIGKFLVTYTITRGDNSHLIRPEKDNEIAKMIITNDIVKVPKRFVNDFKAMLRNIIDMMTEYCTYTHRTTLPLLAFQSFTNMNEWQLIQIDPKTLEVLPDGMIVSLSESEVHVITQTRTNTH